MRLLVVLGLAIVAVIFALQNAAAVTINLFFWRFQASLALVVMICFAVGALLAVIAWMPRLYRMRSNERSLRAQLADRDAVEQQREQHKAAEQAHSYEQRREHTPH